MNQKNLAILVIDDEPQIRQLLSIALKSQGYQPYLCETGKAALDCLRNQHIDLVILDLGLPDLDGKEVLAALRNWSTIPVIVLSVRADEQEKVTLLDIGANDYITKPFSIRELIARIRVIERNVMIHQVEMTSFDDGYLKVDLLDRQVYINQQPIALTKKEFHLLALLIRNQGKLILQSRILREIWGETHQDDTHYLRILVGKLRNKIGDNAIQPRYILTESGIGLRFLMS